MKAVIRHFIVRFFEFIGLGVYKRSHSKYSFENLLGQHQKREALILRGWVFEQPKRLKMLNDRGIRTLIDCGANRGQYVENLKKEGWKGRVFSFEPLRDEYSELSEKAAADPDWTAYHFALGEEEASMEIHVAGNSYSSSLLDFRSEFTDLRPDAKPTETQVINVRSLDEVIATESLDMDGPVMMKLDVQGFELSVLRGAAEFLKQVSILQCELALIPSYEEAPTFHETKSFLEARGFVLAHLIDGHANHLTGELREVDGIFLNTNLSPADGR